MSTLFTIRKSRFDAPSLYEQLGFAKSGDSILLIEDGVLALQSPISLASFLAKCSINHISVFALSLDCELRGICNHYEQVALVDYEGFVNLVTKHEKQVAW